MVLEPGVLVAVADGVVQPGGALERQLAVERGVEQAASSARRGTRRRHAAGAELQLELGRGELVERGEPAVRRRPPAAAAARRRPATSSSSSRERVDHRDQPARVAGQVVLVAQRELDAPAATRPAARVAQVTPARSRRRRR